MKTKKIKSGLLVLPLAALFSGCTLFGLELQKGYPYDYSVPYSNQLEMNGWAFLKKNASSFRNFLAAIEYAGVDTLIFDRPGITIFPLMNGGISSARGTGANGNPGGYWQQHPIINEGGTFTPTAWTDYGDDPKMKEQVKQFILNHIVTLPVSFGEFLDMVPDGRRTFFPTMATNGYGYVSLHMLNFSEAPEAGEKITRLWVNDFPSHFTKTNPGPNWDNKYFYPRTSNLRTLNGSYIHIMENTFLDFPIDSDLETTPIWRGRN
jgi:hypothetical protein